MAQRGAIVLLTVRRAFIGRMFKTAPTHDSHALSIGEGNMTSQIKNERKAWSVLIVSTLAVSSSLFLLAKGLQPYRESVLHLQQWAAQPGRS